MEPNHKEEPEQEEVKGEESDNKSEEVSHEAEKKEETTGSEEGLRKRKTGETASEKKDPTKPEKEEKKSKPCGITPSGERFAVPKTKNPLAFYSPSHWSFWDYTKNVSALNLLWLLFPLPSWFYIALFIFWRLGYNLFLGYILHKQSKDQFLTKYFETFKDSKNIYAPFAGKFLKLGMGADYNFETAPACFNAWLAFRHLVDIILAQDLLTYVVFCLAHIEVPESITLRVLACYAVGLFLCVFTLWAKTDAYRVVKDFAWYWGDFFFLIDQSLTFDRVFSISPHPMYTIGYLFFYGAALIAQSYTVLYVSLFGHFCQLAFLALVENPHIEKTYPNFIEDEAERERRKMLKEQGYITSDLIGFKNFDIFRSADILTLVIVAYTAVLTFLDLPPYFYLLQAMAWRLLQNVGLGYLLHRQSQEQFYTNHFVKLGFQKQYAFQSWKQLYNLSLVMAHMTFYFCAIKYFEGFDFSVGFDRWLFRQTCGLILFAVNLWSSLSTYEVLGDFGWFYADFFVDEVPSKLYYTGIYRFVNNPDSITGFAAYYGAALMADSWTIFGLAVFSQVVYKGFITFVETPHMRKLYGDKVRGTSGMEEAIKGIVSEAVEANDNLKKMVRSASDLNLRAKQEAKKIKLKVSAKAEEMREKAKSKLNEIRTNLPPEIDALLPPSPRDQQQ